MVKVTIIEKPFLQYHGRLSEGPSYNSADNSLSWIDIIGKKIHTVILPSTTLSPLEYTEDEIKGIEKTHLVVNTPDVVGAIGFTTNPEKLIIGCKYGLAKINRRIGGFEYLNKVHVSEKDKDEMRFNDGAIDSKGRFFLGSMNDFHADLGPNGKLYRFDPDGSVEVVLEDLTIPNGIGWSPDGKTMYHTNSLTFTIWAYDFDEEKGTLSNRQPYINVKESLREFDSPEPDGFTMTTDGSIWTAVWSTSRVQRYGPTGELLEEYHFPAKCISCPTFGGPDMDELFVTSANLRHADESYIYPEIGEVDKGGEIFRVKIPGVRGIKKNVWGGEINL